MDSGLRFSWKERLNGLWVGKVSMIRLEKDIGNHLIL